MTRSSLELILDSILDMLNTAKSWTSQSGGRAAQVWTNQSGGEKFGQTHRNIYSK